MIPPDEADPIPPPPPPPTYGRLEPTPAQQADSAGWVLLFAGILIGMLVIAAAAVLAVAMLARR